MARAVLLPLLLLLLAAGQAAAQDGHECPDGDGACDASVQLLQAQVQLRRGALEDARAVHADRAPDPDEPAAVTHAEQATRTASSGQRDLVLMHIPFNFGHTVELIAMLGSGYNQRRYDTITEAPTFSVDGSINSFWDQASQLAQEGSSTWGVMDPELRVMSEVTGCPMYITPPKYWPPSLAARYIGNKTVFGILRDPYERLVAFFRGNITGYGGIYAGLHETCDVNAAVKQMMKRYLAGGSNFSEACTFVPQAEYFEGPYGITLPVNNREFPKSMNDVFLEHGYDYVIKTEDIGHVTDCENVWAADLDAETRRMVRQAYSRDFELLCRHFGYCDQEEICCIHRVPQMCPPAVMQAGYNGTRASLSFAA